MNGKKNGMVWAGLILSASLFAASFTAFFMAGYEKYANLKVWGAVCGRISEKMPDAEPVILAVLKEYQQGEVLPEGQADVLNKENLLLAYGYRQADFLQPAGRYGMGFALAGFGMGGALFIAALLVWRRKVNARLGRLTDYLEKVNTGSGGVLFPAGEDECSKLQDEIYKTVTTLQQTKDAALAAKHNFAENLYNIAHQMKTPLTSISLSVQMMEECPSPAYPEQIRRQLSRLTYLEEALLLLSRIDAGTLPLEKKAVDVFTVLVLAADYLQELFRKENVTVDIPEAGEILINADMDWTMEAVMNLLKNCMEHTPSGGAVHCRYEENPLYVRIRIWDEGEGFAREDIPHLFERFYRGRNAQSGGIGIGLALSKAIIENQNGTVTAQNLTEGGACFEIRFYRH